MTACARMVSRCSLVPSELRVANAWNTQCPSLGIACIVRVVGSSFLARLSCLSLLSASTAAVLIDLASASCSGVGRLLDRLSCVSLFAGFFWGGWFGSRGGVRGRFLDLSFCVLLFVGWFGSGDCGCISSSGCTRVHSLYRMK